MKKEISSHACLLYSSFDERMEAIGSMLNEGAQKHESCIYMTSEQETDEVCAALKHRGLDVMHCLTKGSLEIYSPEDVLKTGPVKPDSVISFIAENANRVLASGFEHVQIIIDSPWRLQSPTRSLAEIETSIDMHVPEDRCTYYCQYNEAAVPSELICEALRVHRVVIRQNRRYTHNPYYEPADIMFAQNVARRVEWMLGQVYRACAAAEELECGETSAKKMDVFLSKLSHELRTPLNCILGWSHMLKSPHIDEAHIAEAHDSIKRNATLMLKLIDDLSDVSRIKAGKLHLNMEKVDVADFVRRTAATLDPILRRHELSMEVICDPQVEHFVVDAVRFQQVIINLFQNCMKFTAAGGRVTVQLRKTHDGIEIRVSDTGIGINSEVLPHVFDSFFQGMEVSQKHGLGLGLTIVKELVELHGGTVRACSDGLGKGATFVVRLPDRTIQTSEALKGE